MLKFKMVPNHISNNLFEILITLNNDYTPYGSTERLGNDCSCGCIWFIKLEGQLGQDWGVCTSMKSHRCGLLTFEHQGCVNFSKTGK